MMEMKSCFIKNLDPRVRELGSYMTEMILNETIRGTENVIRESLLIHFRNTRSDADKIVEKLKKPV